MFSNYQKDEFSSFLIEKLDEKVKITSKNVIFWRKTPTTRRIRRNQKLLAPDIIIREMHGELARSAR